MGVFHVFKNFTNGTKSQESIKLNVNSRRKQLKLTPNTTKPYNWRHYDENM